MGQLLINIIGYNASGKTTVAKRLASSLKLNRVNGDDFRNFVYDNVPYFNGLDISYPTPKGTRLTPLVMHYRFELSRILLCAGQSVIFEGSGFTREHRQHIQQIRGKVPDVKTVLLWVDISEPELLKRLTARDKGQTTRWMDMYHDFKKTLFEAPTSDEADLVIRYDQNNYQEIEQKIQEFLELA